MLGDRVAAAPLDVPQGALETLVGKRLDPAAVVTDDVMMVLFVVAHGLEAREAVAEVDPLHEPLLLKHVKHAVDAREADAVAALNELAVDLLRPEAAVLSAQEFDHALARNPAPVAGGLQFG